MRKTALTIPVFLSTPSSQRATLEKDEIVSAVPISIHALFAEGDRGRRARRCRRHGFLSTPSSQRATGRGAAYRRARPISIHALFAEGDVVVQLLHHDIHAFLSTPSSQRATGYFSAKFTQQNQFLSTPSSQRATMRTAGHDITGRCDFYPRPLRRGRPYPRGSASFHGYFYPRPLRRGRRVSSNTLTTRGLFLSTPSSQRATNSRCLKSQTHSNFYPRPLRRGRRVQPCWSPSPSDFYPRPLRRGRRARTAPARRSRLPFLSTPSSQRATAELSKDATVL